MCSRDATCAPPTPPVVKSASRCRARARTQPTTSSRVAYQLQLLARPPATTIYRPQSRSTVTAAAHSSIAGNKFAVFTKLGWEGSHRKRHQDAYKHTTRRLSGGRRGERACRVGHRRPIPDDVDELLPRKTKQAKQNWREGDRFHSNRRCGWTPKRRRHPDGPRSSRGRGNGGKTDVKTIIMNVLRRGRTAERVVGNDGKSGGRRDLRGRAARDVSATAIALPVRPEPAAVLGEARWRSTTRKCGDRNRL